MAAASERRELSAAASRRPSAYPAAVHKESRHITVRRPASPPPPPPRQESRPPPKPEGRREEIGRRAGRAGGEAGRGGAPAGRGGERRRACPVWPRLSPGAAPASASAHRPGKENGRKLQPASGRGEPAWEGSKARWKDTRATVGTTFRRRSRVVLVGELSKFPFPSVCSGGKSLDPSALLDGHPGWGRPDPSSFRSERRIAPTGGPQERCRGQRLGSWLHKHPHPSTCPRHPSLLAAASLCTVTRRVLRLLFPFACNP
ncbi:LOW QUALITY PROTEIN: killin [Mesocricetus auratus]|uniref:LOW QUALITY PROTEIN: killin n=1 Tax=Mesocricetus auratus TaxID=10036 RepID=A0A3Q0CZP6_MESAU|nr:LOW QUALITY PROTEIN: killin [Mesocricetus auratus]